MRISDIVFTLLFLFTHTFPDDSKNTNNEFDSETLPEAFMTTMELITYHGYKGEEFSVITEDGYVIEIFRIYGPKKHSFGQPVIILHGFASISSTWLLNLPHQNLPYILADEGFDVWLGNTRGNKHGQRHLKLDISQPNFWKFGTHEMGIYDLAAIVDFILKKTTFDKVVFIGHSLASAYAFSLLTTRPEYNKKFKIIFGLAPAVYLSHMRTTMYPYMDMMKYYFMFMNNYAIFADDFMETIYSLEKYLNWFPFHNTTFTGEVLAKLAGNNPEHLNKTRLPVYLHHDPATTSLQALLHVLQLIDTGKFAQLDYGPLENQKIYKQATPPEYDLSLIDCPVVLYRSPNDLMVDIRDVEILSQKIKHLKGNYIVSDTKFTHYDYQWATNAKDVLYNHIVHLLKE